MDLSRLEIELKKRLDYPYFWGRRQQDDWDHRTNFIYTTYDFSTLLSRLATLDKKLINYGLNRWYNFWSAMAAEHLFSIHPEVLPNKNKYDKFVDFSIDNIAFDHKTSVLPKGFNHSYTYALEHKEELIQWLYNNQSQQGRKHLANRLFILLYDNKTGQHWQLKAEISLLKKAIDNYINDFSKNKLIRYKDSYSDVIWVTKD